MLALAQWVVLLSGWPRRLVAVLAGAVGALALAPVSVPVAMIVPMTIAVWLIDGSARSAASAGVGRGWRWRSCRAAAAIGWWWGLGYFIAGFWWLGAAFLVEPSRDAWALPLGVLGVPAMLALFPALGFAIARLVWSTGPSRILALAAGLGLTEWLRGWVLTGFPWNSYGMALGDNLVLAQVASVIGVDGLTLLAIALCAAPATLADPPRPGREGTTWRRWIAIVCALVATVGLCAFGWARLSGGPVPTVPDVRLRIMQPDVAEDDSFSYANKDKILADYLALSTRKTSDGMAEIGDITHLIWPESSFPFILAHDPEALASIAEALGAKTILVTGAARSSATGPVAEGAAGDTKYYNAIQVVGPEGTILDTYDKVHLVPFGEYLPLGDILRRVGLTNFVHVPGGFTAGTHRRLIDVPGLPPVAPIICYEAIFSGQVLPATASATRKVGLLLNVTNDGWFGQTSGPYQHLAMARLRSIEDGLPLVRAANSGVSAIVDPYGRITASLPLGARGVLDGALPTTIDATLFRRHGGLIDPALFAILVVAALGLRRSRTFG